MLTGKTHEVELFITKLDKGYSMVLGYDWLLPRNPTINWVETKVIFKTPPAPLKIKTPPTTIKICKVSARNFHKHSQEPGATTYMVSNLGSTLHSGYSIKPIHTKSAELDANSPTFPPEYQEFADVFSGEKVNMLAPHCPYDLQINTEGDAKPFYGPIYSLSQPELTALHEFLDKNTQNGFIRPSPVLFVKKKGMAVFNYAWTTMPSTKLLGKIDTCFHSSVTYGTPQAHPRSIQRSTLNIPT